MTTCTWSVIVNWTFASQWLHCHVSTCNGANSIQIARIYICPGTCSPGKSGGKRLPVMMPALAITGCPMPVIAGNAVQRQKTDYVFLAGLHYMFCRQTTGLPVLPHYWHSGNSNGNGAAKHILHCTLPAKLRQTTPPKFVVLAGSSEYIVFAMLWWQPCEPILLLLNKDCLCRIWVKQP